MIEKEKHQKFDLNKIKLSHLFIWKCLEKRVRFMCDANVTLIVLCCKIHKIYEDCVHKIYEDCVGTHTKTVCVCTYQMIYNDKSYHIGISI